MGIGEKFNLDGVKYTVTEKIGDGGFRRPVRTAVNYNRFAVMGDVRQAFAAEADQAVQADYLAILEEEDPSAMIHGRGIIPGRNP